MNSFYGILKVFEKSDIKIDYYNKLKISFSLLCVDGNSGLFFNLLIDEKFVDKYYSKLNVNDYVFAKGYVNGYILDKINITIRELEIFE